MRILRNIFIAILIVCFPFFAVESKADLATTDPSEAVYMVLGELETYPVVNLTRLSIANPDIADIVSAEANELLLIAKSVGTTILFIWDDGGKRTVTVNVFSQNLGSVQARLSDLFKLAEINQVVLEKNEREGKLVITGFVPSSKEEEFSRIIEPFQDSIINFTEKEEVNNLVQIDMQITELNTTLSKKLGVDWSTGTAAGSGISLAYPETLPTDTAGSVKDLLRIGEFGRTTALLATIQALINEGQGKILSQPKLVVMSGEEASFLVGGEVPIRSSTVSTGVVTETVTFKNFGIGMTVTPTIKKNKVDITLNVEVSEVDPSTASSVSATVAFTKRSASTRLFLNDGQTIIMAGLIKKSKSLSESRVPFLSKIPVAGLLFRQKSNPVADQDQELVITLTPHILSQKEDDSKTAVQKTADTNKDQTNVQAPSPANGSNPVAAGHGGENGSAVKDASAGQNDNTAEPTAGSDHNKSAEDSSLSVNNAVAAEDSPSSANNAATGVTVEAPTAGMGLTTASNSSIPEELKDYVTNLQKKIVQAAQYPQEAREYGWEGTVKLNLLILNDGTLAFVLIKESSGYEIFDEYAIRRAKGIAPYDSFPANTNLKELNVTIPIVYNLKAN